MALITSYSYNGKKNVTMVTMVGEDNSNFTMVTMMVKETILKRILNKTTYPLVSSNMAGKSPTPWR